MAIPLKKDSMEKNSATELQEVTNDFLKMIGQVPAEKLNEVPPIGGWTAGQVGEHILKSGDFIVMALRAPGKETDRDPAEKVKPLSDIFLNFDIKMKGPGFIEPSDEAKDKTNLLRSLQEIFDTAHTVAATADLSKTCAGVDMPGMGEMTRLEWISFLNVHTRRHTHQLENIRHSIA